MRYESSHSDLHKAAESRTSQERLTTSSAIGVVEMDTLPIYVRILKIRAKSFKGSFSLSRKLKRDRQKAKETKVLTRVTSVGGRDITKGLIGPPSVVHLRVNGHQCDA